MAERIVEVEQIDEQWGPYHVTGTVTRVYDPAFAERIQQTMTEWAVSKLPELLAERRRQQESAAD